MTLRITYGNVRFFLGGDLNQEAMSLLNEKFSASQLQSEILKIPHHGSADFDLALLKKVADEHGRNMAQFALAWVLNQPAITSAICGISSAKQLEINAAAVDITLSQEELDACDEVWHQLRPPRFLYGR